MLLIWLVKLNLSSISTPSNLICEVLIMIWSSILRASVCLSESCRFAKHLCPRSHERSSGKWSIWATAQTVHKCSQRVLLWARFCDYGKYTFKKVWREGGRSGSTLDTCTRKYNKKSNCWVSKDIQLLHHICEGSVELHTYNLTHSLTWSKVEIRLHGNETDQAEILGNYCNVWVLRTKNMQRLHFAAVQELGLQLTIRAAVNLRYCHPVVLLVTLCWATHLFFFFLFPFFSSLLFFSLFFQKN